MSPTEFFAANQQFIKWVARRAMGRGLGFDDLVQEGAIGLLKAVEKFDYTRGYKFSTYAKWPIWNAMKRGILDAGLTVRLSRDRQERMTKLSMKRDMLIDDLGYFPSDGQLANEADIPVSEIKKLRITPKVVMSLDQEEPPQGLLKDKDNLDPLEAVTSDGVQETLNEYLGALTERERRVLDKLFYENYTPREVAEELGVRRQYVERVRDKALGKLRMLDQKLDGQLWDHLAA